MPGLRLALRGLSATLLLAAVSAGWAADRTFSNPLLPAGADPWILWKDGWYYYTNTTGRNLTLWKTRSIAGLASAEKKVVWTPPPGQPYSRQLWAPELHFIGGAWYFYFAADDGRNRNHRLYVLENKAADPFQGEWELKGKVSTPDDRWAIDASVFETGGRQYMVWSGWEGDENGRQDIYIVRMKNPWTPDGQRVRLSMPEHRWEKSGYIAKPGPDDKPYVFVNEGPQPLIRGNRIFLVYSASGCWTDDYALGLLHANLDSDLLDPKSWRKLPEPVFSAVGANLPGVHAAGHNSFFRSPDGTEDWILYHANPEPGGGCGGKRSPRAQPFTWSSDGFPVFGRPVAPGAPVRAPSEKPADLRP
jgi:GH43 family beta-xylosidase